MSEFEDAFVRAVVARRGWSTSVPLKHPGRCSECGGTGWTECRWIDMSAEIDPPPPPGKALVRREYTPCRAVDCDALALVLREELSLVDVV